MNDLVRIRSGALGDRAEMPKLRYDSELGSEIAYRTDKKELYIGSSGGNVRLCGAGDTSEINAKINAITAKIDEINGNITNIIARLDALTPSE